MRAKNKLTYLKEYRKAKEVTDAMTTDLEFLEKEEGKFDPFQKAIADGNFEAEEVVEEPPKKRARLD